MDFNPLTKTDKIKPCKGAIIKIWKASGSILTKIVETRNLVKDVDKIWNYS